MLYKGPRGEHITMKGTTIIRLNVPIECVECQTAVRQPVEDPNNQPDMVDMGDGNYRRMAAYEEE